MNIFDTEAISVPANTPPSFGSGTNLNELELIQAYRSNNPTKNPLVHEGWQLFPKDTIDEEDKLVSIHL